MKETLKKLGFEYDNINDWMCMRFRGYRIDYSICSNEFYFNAKESDSYNDCYWETDPKICKNKRAKEIWYLIQEIIKFKNLPIYKTDFDYINIVINILINMYQQKTTEVEVNYHVSGNQYEMAKKGYIRIKEEMK